MRACLLICAVAAALVCAAPAFAADAPFSVRYATTAHGNVDAVGNILLTCPTAAANCTAARAGTAGGSALNNNSYTMGYVDVDGDATTFDSSEATLTLPAGASVLWAGLYWSADTSAGSTGAAAAAPVAKDTVELAGPTGGYATVTAAPADVLTSSVQPSRYRAFADVTALVQSKGAGPYTVANVQAGTGQDRYAGWSLIVAYRDAAQAMRRLTVYDGLGTVDASHPYTTTVAPFHTPAAGTVSTRVGLLTFEGDAGLVGDSATFNGHPLADALNPSDNAMNSTIETGGVAFTAKNPDQRNQLGMDLDTFVGTGMLDNDQSSAQLAFSSPNEYFMPSALFLVSDEGPATSTAPPVLGGGTAVDGQTLTATSGGWNGTPTFTYAYQWQRCDAAGANCVDIPGATGSTYTLTGADAGHRVRVVVTATNAAGSSAPAASAPTSVVAFAPPVVLTAPAVPTDGPPGAPLTVDPGTWGGSTPTLVYRWQRCDAAGEHCIDIPGASGPTYTPTDDDQGHTVRVVVTATNPAGSRTVVSAPVSVRDLSAVPGALVSDASCQQLVGGGKYRRVMLHGIGDVRVRAYTSGPALKTSPVQLTTRVAGGHARSVVYKLDGRRLRSAHGATHRATITPARLGRIGSHVLVTTLRGRRGKPRAIWLTLRTVRCHTLFTAQRWRTLAGQGLRLRVDARSALRRIRFAVPAALLPRAGAARTIGFIRLYLSGRARPVRRALRFARRGSRMLKAAGWPTVVRTRRGLDVTGLPAGTAVAELTLYRVTRLDGRTTARRLRITARISARTSTVLRRRPPAPR